MNLLHLVPHIDKEAAGPAYSVPRLCQSLAIDGNNVHLMCIAARGEISNVEISLYPQWRILKRFAISTALARSLFRRSNSADVVHNHSLWSMVNVAAGWIVPGRRAKLVTSPRGTLSTWALAHSRGVKRLIWPMQRRALARADLLHATSSAEVDEIRAQGFDAPIALIPNGIDLPEIDRGPNVQGVRTLLYVGRIHPIKALDRLIAAWLLLQTRHEDWRLVVAGPGDSNYVQEIKDLVASSGAERVHFVGGLYGENKRNAYLGAELFVLPTHSENFGMVVAEALAHGCPAVVSKGAPWSGLNEEGCGWWTENTVNSLTKTLDDAMTQSPDCLREMGLRGRDWMARDYSWQAIGEKMNASYKWILHGGKQPAWIDVKS